jgi:hypothetical protein
MRLPSHFPGIIFDFIDELVDIPYGLCVKEQNQESFPILIYDTRRCKCTDPHDRVFAPLSLCTDFDEKPAIAPDYSKTIAETYRRALLCYIKSTGWLYLEDFWPEDHFPEAPSWVPNWNSQEIPGNPINHTFASLSTTASVLELDQTLRILGLRID